MKNLQFLNHFVRNQEEDEEKKKGVKPVKERLSKQLVKYYNLDEGELLEGFANPDMVVNFLHKYSNCTLDIESNVSNEYITEYHK